MNKQKKEYQILYDYPERDTEGEMNKLATDGWVLAFVIPGHHLDPENDRPAQFVMERDFTPEAAS